METVSKKPHLRLITWNIHKGIGGLDRRYRLERVVEVLVHQKPDVVLLQEVAEGMPSTRRHNQVELLSSALGLTYVAYNKEHSFRIGGYGNAILSRFQLSDVQHVDLTIGWHKKRGAICARTHVHHNGHERSLVMFNLHLGLIGAERAQQLGRFLRCDTFAGLHHRTPIVMAGDMNDLWGSIGQRFLAPVGFRRAGYRFNTFPAILPARPLDAIFLRGDLRSIHYGTRRSALARAASDHLPLVADLELG